MILSDLTLKEMLADGRLLVEPLEEHSVQPASVDCRLGSHFLVIEQNSMDVLSLDKEIIYREFEGDSITLPPHSFLLATTMETVRLPNNLTAFVEGRSSIGRMGLFIQNAGWVDPGFEGRITLELYNANSLPIRLQAGRRICQLVFCKMDRDTPNPYRGKYQGQSRSVGSRVFLDADNPVLPGQPEPRP
ncbi:MAG: dCTP deaminase [Calditrichaeota bacterium]|nr:dCTP deaminase [Calditrichota bacterium]MCB9473877.1 dCTP deaminase [Candidatus Delongbacteria bacterium]